MIQWKRASITSKIERKIQNPNPTNNNFENESKRNTIKNRSVKQEIGTTRFSLCTTSKTNSKEMNRVIC